MSTSTKYLNMNTCTCMTNTISTSTARRTTLLGAQTSRTATGIGTSLSRTRIRTIRTYITGIGDTVIAPVDTSGIAKCCPPPPRGVSGHLAKKKPATCEGLDLLTEQRVAFGIREKLKQVKNKPATPVRGFSRQMYTLAHRIRRTFRVESVIEIERF